MHSRKALARDPRIVSPDVQIRHMAAYAVLYLEHVKKAPTASGYRLLHKKHSHAQKFFMKLGKEDMAAERATFEAKRRLTPEKFEVMCRRLAQRAQDHRFHSAALKKVIDRNRRKKEANIALAAKFSAQKKERAAARKERDDFLRAWHHKYAHLFSTIKECRRIAKNRREQRENATKGVGVAAHVRAINRGPITCYWCQRHFPDGGHADHVVPLSKGGTHTVENIVPSCPPCNTAKGDKLGYDLFL